MGGKFLDLNRALDYTLKICFPTARRLFPAAAVEGLVFSFGAVLIANLKF
jgi:hypothetical protein